MSFWRSWFPALSFFPPEQEQEFRLRLYQQTRYATIRVAWLVIFLICIYILLDVLKWQPEFWAIELLRLVAIAVTLVIIAVIRQGSTRQHHLACYSISALFVGFNLLLFYQAINVYGYLGSGGPMLTVVTYAIIPVLHVGQKLVVWVLIGLGLIGLHVYSEADLFLTLVFYGLTVVATFISQYQRDRLLRMNYRAEVVEREKAKMDELTGLYNRRGLESKVNQILKELEGEDKLALGIVDVDYFKRYNDHYGHLQGDVALKSVASCLAGLDVDMVVRFGGEEFIILKRYRWREPDWVQAVCQNIESLCYAHSQSPFGHLTVSMGVVVIGQQNASEYDSSKLLAIADKALYQAKDEGRNKVILNSMVE